MTPADARRFGDSRPTVPVIQQNRYVKEVVRHLREEYGVADVRVSAGGNHLLATFTYNGQPHKVTLNQHKDRGKAVAIKFRDLRRMLGPPPDLSPPARRTLKEMTPMLRSTPLALADSSPEPEVELTSLLMACYRDREGIRNLRLRFLLPGSLGSHPIKELFPAAVSVRRVGDIAWEFHSNPIHKRPTFNKNGSGYVIDISESEVVGLEPFGVSPATALYAAGVLTVTCDVATRVPLKVRDVAVRVPSEPIKRPRRQVIRSGPPIDEAHVRSILEELRRIEARSGYRLIKTEAGSWAFESRIE